MTGVFDKVTQIYRLTAHYFLALPLIFALPGLAQVAQHFVEFKLGTFVRGDGIQPGD